MSDSLIEDRVVKWHIYKITSPTGRIYIGKTMNIKKRRASYRHGMLRDQRAIKASILKYGWDLHVFEIIDEFQSGSSFANGKEMFWIKTYMSNTNRYKEARGLNLTDGGEGTLGMKLSEATKAKIAKKAVGRIVSDERRKAVSLQHMGNKYNLGRKPSQESIRKRMETKRLNGKVIIRPKATEATKRKMSKSHKGKVMSAGFCLKTKNRLIGGGKKVVQYDIDGNAVMIHNNPRCASEYTGVSIHKIRYQCGKNQKIRRDDNIVFKYKTDV